MRLAGKMHERPRLGSDCISTINSASASPRSGPAGDVGKAKPSRRAGGGLADGKQRKLARLG